MAEITLEEAPRKARDLFQKGIAAMERGNLDYAMDMFASALEIEPRMLRARKFLLAAAVRKFKEGGGGLVQHILSTLTGLPGLLMGSAALNKKPEQALVTAEKLLRQDPLNKSFVRLFGQAAIKANMPEAAIQTLEVARDHYPKDTKLLEWLGRLYLDVNEMKKGRECFEEIVRLRPNDLEAVRALKDASALDTMQQGGWDGADSFRDVMKDTKEAVLLEQEAKAVKSDKDLSELVEETRRKIVQEPQNINYRRSLADLLTREQRFDEALEALEAARELAAGDPQIDRAISGVRQRRFDAEIKQCEAAGDQAGAEAKRAEKETFLLEDAREKVQRYPNDLQFRYELGQLLFEREEWNEAIQQFQLAQRNPQRRIRALYYLARCFEHKGQFDIAMEQLDKAASELHLMDETKKDIVYAMGTIAEQMGNKDKAIACFKDIYGVDIGYRDIAERIDRAYKS